ncbi:MAG: hypothetical protein ACK5N0_01545 [Synechococcaceae cyanobacterium]
MGELEESGHGIILCLALKDSRKMVGQKAMIFDDPFSIGVGAKTLGLKHPLVNGNDHLVTGSRVIPNGSA